MTEPRSVLVTGASGFIAKHVVLQLLRAGHRVTGSLRSEARAGEVRDAVRPQLPDGFDLEAALRFVTLDLGRDDGWGAAMAGQDVLIHTASPFPLIQPADESELIRPAVEGTRRALRAARDAGVGRVILTSSIAAVVSTELPAGRARYTEADWSEPSHPTANAYGKSKTLAERAAWDFVRDEAPELALTTINPGLVLGRPLDATFGTSLQVVERVLRGRDPVLPQVGFPVVDVTDIARMHLAAMERPEAAGQRFLGAAEFMWFTEIAATLAAAHPERRIPVRRAPDLLIRALALFDRSIAVIVPALGRRTDLDTTRAREILGIQFTPAAECVRASGEYLVASGRV